MGISPVYAGIPPVMCCPNCGATIPNGDVADADQKLSAAILEQQRRQFGAKPAKRRKTKTK